jgi:hypothetical protein
MTNTMRRLTVEQLEGRDVPAQLYAVTLDTPSQGRHGDSALTVTAGGLATAVNVWADSPAEAVKLGVSGRLELGGQAYEFSPQAVGTSAAGRQPFLLAATATGYQIWLEDLAGTPNASDWDYNDTAWDVGVVPVSPPTAPPPPMAPPLPPLPNGKDPLPTETPKPRDPVPAVPKPGSGNDKDGKPYLPEKPVVIPYKDTPEKNAPYQGGHLYQQSPFNTWIHSGRAGTIPMYGNTYTPEDQHYTFHYYIDQFWDQYRVGGAKAGKLPTLDEYEATMRNALEKMGYTADEAKRIQEDARKMMDDYRAELNVSVEYKGKYPPLKGTDPVPYIPPPTVPPGPKPK